uniref:DUF2723 domain-containing protein n=1 Tax=Ignavibacterium album TaxID=591197 RepID=A0A832G8E7_9BACT
MEFKYLKEYHSEFIGIFVFIFYLITVGRSIGEIDSGELALAQATLSIPHPTGYPFFSLVGFIFSKIPLPFSTLFKLNILNSIWCALTVVVVIKTSFLLLKNLQIIFNKKFLRDDNFNFTNESGLRIISVFSGLMFGFSATFWLQSTKVEVYALQIFITSLIIYSTIKIAINSFQKESIKDRNYKNVLKDGFPIALLIGLGFSNHLMTIYLLPALVLTFIFLYGINKESIKAFSILIIIVFAIAILFYLGLMFRAQMSPPWSYGDPSNLERLIEHVTAKEYSKYLLDSTDGLIKQGSKLLKMLSFNFNNEKFSLGEFGLSLFLGIAGLLLIFVLRKKFVSFFLLIIFVSITTALSYSIPDINEYFLVTFLVISICAILPLIIIFNFVHSKKLFKYIFYPGLLFLIIIQVLSNFDYANRSKFYVIEDFFKSFVNSLPENSIFLTDNWASILSPALYYQNVEKVRPDVNFISPSGYIQFEWYRKIKKHKLYDSSYAIIPKENLFVAYDIGYRIIGKNILKLPSHYSLIPLRNFYVLGIDTIYYPLKQLPNEIRFSENITSESEKYIRILIPTILEQRLLYELEFKKYLNAKIVFEELLRRFPEYKLSENTLRVLYHYKILN